MLEKEFFKTEKSIYVIKKITTIHVMYMHDLYTGINIQNEENMIPATCTCMFKEIEVTLVICKQLLKCLNLYPIICAL